ncbi:MAG TPA: PBP1A family penicillin-binding protein [Thermoanaerobaculia bacterium]
MPKRRSRLRDFLWRHSAGLAFLVMFAFVVLLAGVGYTYVVITKKFDSARRWDLPSRVFSDATPIVPGGSYSRALLEPKLNHTGYREVAKRVENPGEYRYVDGDLEIYLNNFEYPDMEFHAMPVLVQMNGSTVRAVRRLTDDIALRGIRIEPELITSIYDNQMEDRVPVSLDAIPKSLIDAVIATEDKSFYRHEGISIRGIARAIWTDVRSKSLAAGGSTLTQQLVKNLYLNPERTFRRKATEAVMALLLEMRYSKDQILEAYLNEIYLGQNGSVQIVGVEQAAQVYFGKKVTYITLPEAATLAGMIRSPNVLSPIRHSERVKDRRNLILGLMRDQGMVSDEEYRDAVKSPMSVNPFPKSSRSAPFFVDFVLKQLRETYPETQLKTEGLRIFTTLDATMQRSAEAALDEGIEDLGKKYRHIRNSETPLEGTVITIQPGTGYVKALVGGRNYAKTQFNRAIQARRQPGSLFKPFVYVTAMDPSRRDAALTAASVLDDSPINVQAGTAVWRPKNYDNRFRGRVSVREALAHSYNIPAVRAAIDVGVANVVTTATNIGVQSRLEPYPSISLGSFEVTPLEIAFAYSVFANLGVKSEPVSILSVVTRDGQLLESRNSKMTRVAPASVAYVMNDMLKDVFRYGTAGRARSLGFKSEFAGKTGTTNDYRDAWFVGYSPHVLSLVWIGFDNGQNVRLAGGDACLPIWTKHMNRVGMLVPNGDWRRPEDVNAREIDPLSGLLATPYCPRTRSEIFVAGTEPVSVCPLHARSGDPSPFWHDPEDWRESGERAEAGDPGSGVDEGREKAREKDNSIRKLLRRIFGD